MIFQSIASGLLGVISCSKSCGTGQRQKSRSIKINAKNGGVPCQGSYTQIDACTNRPCKFLIFLSRFINITSNLCYISIISNSKSQPNTVSHNTKHDPVCNTIWFLVKNIHLTCITFIQSNSNTVWKKKFASFHLTQIPYSSTVSLRIHLLYYSNLKQHDFDSLNRVLSKFKK